MKNLHKLKNQRWAIQRNGHKTWHGQGGQRGATIAERGKRKNTAGADFRFCLQNKERNEQSNSGICVGEIIVWYSNADVLTKDKLTELKCRIKNNSTPPHVIAISEVKPKHFKRQLTLQEGEIFTKHQWGLCTMCCIANNPDERRRSAKCEQFTAVCQSRQTAVTTA